MPDLYRRLPAPRKRWAPRRTVPPPTTQTLQAALAGVGAVGGTLTRGVRPKAALTGVGSVGATLTVPFLYASLAGVGAVSATLTRGVRPTAALAGVGAVSAALTRGVRLQAALAGVGAVSAPLRLQFHLQAALAGIGSINAAMTQVIIVTVPSRQRPRVYIHDGATLYRVAQLTAVTDINRAYSLRDRNRSAQFTVALDDAALSYTNPRYGHVIVIESTEYPLPWVGRIIERQGNRADRTVTVAADQYDAILNERILPTEFTTTTSSDDAFRQIIARINGANPTGIGIGSVEERFIPELSLPNVKGSDALDKLAEVGGLEWWLNYSLDMGRLLIYANLRGERGADYFDPVTLVGPDGNFEVTQWRERNNDVYAQMVIGGETSVLEAFTERERSIAIRSQDTFRADDATLSLVVEANRVLRFGHALAGETSFRAPTTRRERITVREELKAAGVTGTVAEALIDRRFYPSQVIQGRAYPDAAIWQYLTPGNVVHLKSGDAFVDGYDGGAVIIGVQPMEHDRFVELVLEIS